MSTRPRRHPARRPGRAAVPPAAREMLDGMAALAPASFSTWRQSLPKRVTRRRSTTSVTTTGSSSGCACISQHRPRGGGQRRAARCARGDEPDRDEPVARAATTSRSSRAARRTDRRADCDRRSAAYRHHASPQPMAADRSYAASRTGRASSRCRRAPSKPTAVINRMVAATAARWVSRSSTR